MLHTHRWLHNAGNYLAEWGRGLTVRLYVCHKSLVKGVRLDCKHASQGTRSHCWNAAAHLDLIMRWQHFQNLEREPEQLTVPAVPNIAHPWHEEKFLPVDGVFHEHLRVTLWRNGPE